MPTMNGMDLDRMLEVLKEMLALAREGRCAICGWPVEKEGVATCGPGKCAYIPQRDSYEDRKIKERYAALGYKDGIV